MSSVSGYGRSVSTWFERNTHHADEWTLEQLLAAKGDRSVSLVVPARNEASTVGGIVERLRTALMGTAALVDEIVVIDSDSTDGTAEAAAAAGAQVYGSGAIRPDLGTYPGKAKILAGHCAAVGRDPDTIERSAGVQGSGQALLDQAEPFVKLGVTFLTVGVGGPDYDLTGAEALTDWRDRR